MTNGLLNHPLHLPNGRTLKNRLAKAALSECLADVENGPSVGLLRVYERWAQGGAGLVITGNVMVDGRARTEPNNVVVEDERHYQALQHWADTGKNNGVTLIAQLNHPGRQAVRTDRRPV